METAAIVELYARRSKEQMDAMASMKEFERYLRGDLQIALPEVGENEKSAIANLAAQGLEQMSLRAASTLPDLKAPPTKANVDLQVKRAQKRRQAVLGWWDANDMGQILTLRAQYMFAHGLAPVTVLPDPETCIPVWRVRSPLDCYPAPMFNPVDITPRNCVFTATHTWGWLKDRYAPRILGLARPQNTSDDDLFTVLEYMDAKEIVWVAAAAKPTTTTSCGMSTTAPMIGTERAVELERIPNKAETPLAFVPGWTTIIGNRGKFTGTIGAHQMRAKLLALAYLTAYKGAMPEVWVDPIDAQAIPEVIQTPNPQTGEVGIITGGRLAPLQVNPGFMTSPMLSILEREIRIEGGIPAEFGGESASNVRTGRRGDQILGGAIDYPIQRAQRLFEQSLTAESKAAIAIVKKWTPSPKSFYVNWRNASGQVDYDPAVDLDSDQVKAVYSLAGSDLNSDIVRVGQKIGTGEWSRQTARENDPETPDAEVEKDRVTSERLEELGWTLLQQGIAQGTIGPDELAFMDSAILADRLELIPALVQAHKQAQEKQAAAAAQQPQPGDPNAQPGMGAPPLMQPPTDDMSNFKQALSALHPSSAQLGVTRAAPAMVGG